MMEMQVDYQTARAAPQETQPSNPKSGVDYGFSRFFARSTIAASSGNNLAVAANSR